jgi:hypothetical protein
MLESPMQTPRWPDCSSGKTVVKIEFNQKCDLSQQKVQKKILTLPGE